MSFIRVTDDGITEITIMPSPQVRQLPTYGDWKMLLVAKGVGRLFATGGNRKDGSPKMDVKIHDQVAQMIDGQVKIHCLNCGLPFSRLDMSTITIGALVRMPLEESTGKDEITIRTVMRPVSKTGLGCRACSGLMDVEIRKVNAENKVEEQIERNEAEIAMLRGVSRAQVKHRNPKIAFIPVLEGDHDL